MNRTFLRDIIEDISISTLPYNWNYFNLENFSKDKRLWDFQQKAVENAIKVLWKYYEDFVDFQNGEKFEINQERKKKLFEWYKDNGLEEDLDIRLDKRKRKIYDLLVENYSSQDGKVPYLYFYYRNYIICICTKEII